MPTAGSGRAGRLPAQGWRCSAHHLPSPARFPDHLHGGPRLRLPRPQQALQELPQSHEEAGSRLREESEGREASLSPGKAGSGRSSGFSDTERLDVCPAHAVRGVGRVRGLRGSCCRDTRRPPRPPWCLSDPVFHRAAPALSAQDQSERLGALLAPSSPHRGHQCLHADHVPSAARLLAAPRPRRWRAGRSAGTTTCSLSVGTELVFREAAAKDLHHSTGP